MFAVVQYRDLRFLGSLVGGYGGSGFRKHGLDCAEGSQALQRPDACEALSRAPLAAHVWLREDKPTGQVRQEAHGLIKGLIMPREEGIMAKTWFDPRVPDSDICVLRNLVDQRSEGSADRVFAKFADCGEWRLQICARTPLALGAGHTTH
jgi:hypothetical protein